MSLATQSRLYFIAAGLCVIADALSISNEGVEVKTLVGVIFAGGMIMLGLKARKTAQDGQPS